MSVSFRPLHDRVLLKRQEATEKTPGGLIIPENAKEKPTFAEVMAVGSGKLLQDGTVRPLEVKAGDTVMISKFSGNEVKIDGQEFVLVREEELLGVVEK